VWPQSIFCMSLILLNSWKLTLQAGIWLLLVVFHVHSMVFHVHLKRMCIFSGIVCCVFSVSVNWKLGDNIVCFYIITDFHSTSICFWERNVQVFYYKCKYVYFSFWFWLVLLNLKFYYRAHTHLILFYLSDVLTHLSVQNAPLWPWEYSLSFSLLFSDIRMSLRFTCMTWLFLSFHLRPVFFFFSLKVNF